MAELEIRRWPADKPLESEIVAEARDGFGCDLWADPPGRLWLDFVHPAYERGVVREGRIEFEVEGARAMPGRGDEVFIPDGRCHGAWDRGPSAARWFYGYKHQ